MAIVLKSQDALGQIREQAVGGWRDMKSERQELEATWRRCLMAYLCHFDKNWVAYAKAAGRSYRYLGVSFDAVETWVPQVYDAILGRDEAINLRPMREGMDNEQDDQLAEDMKYLLRFQMEYGKYRRTMMQGIKSLAILGNCPWWVDWYVRKAVNYEAFASAMKIWMEQAAAYKQEHDSVMQDWQDISIKASLAMQDGPPMPEFSPPPEPPVDTDIVFQGPVLRIGSIFNYVQEQHPNDDMSAVRIMRSWRTSEYLKKLAVPGPDGYRLYSNLANVKDVTSEDRAGDNEAESLMKMAFGMTMPRGKDKIELKEMQGTFEILSGPEKGTYENHIAVVANDHTVIRFEPSPMFSGRLLINNARLTTLQGLPYGIGILEMALDEQDTANAVHNQNIDATNCIIQPELEVVTDLLVDGIMKPSGPGARHEVIQGGAIRAIDKNFSGLQVGVAIVDAAIARHERITGAVNTAGGSRESATRTARNANVIATKLGGAVEAVEEDFVSEALNTAMEMNAQYIEEDVVFSVTQNKKSVVKKISPVEIRRGWLVRVAGSKYMAEKQERIQNLMMATQISAQAEAGGQPSPVRKEILYARLFKEVLGSADDIVMSSQEYKELLTQFQAAQAQAQIAMAQSGQQDAGASGQAQGAPGSAPAGAP